MREYFNPAIGRWFVQLEDGSWDYRYRVVMAQHLGRPLRTDEHVHHVNRIKTDDRLENLAIKTPAEHAEIHAAERLAGRKAKWLHDWSPKHAACAECGTTEREHVGKGLCNRCYFTLRKRITGGHQPRRPAEIIVRLCPTCGEEFSRTRGDGVHTYCSRSCAGRSRGTSRAKPARRVPKLTVEQVAYIRESTERGVDLATRFGISQQYVCNIRKGRVAVSLEAQQETGAAND
jgi:hypothetical protein